MRIWLRWPICEIIYVLVLVLVLVVSIHNKCVVEQLVYDRVKIFEANQITNINSIVYPEQT